MLVRPATPLILLGSLGLALLGACSLPDVKVGEPSQKSSASESQAAKRDAAAPSDADMDAALETTNEETPPVEPDPQGMPKHSDAGAKAPAPPRDAGTPTPDASTTPVARDEDAGPESDVGNVFAAWPMPDAFPGSQTQPSYGTRANAVIDTITRLEWQALLPKVYPGCTGMHPNGTQGDCCTWLEAAAYCKSYGEALGQMGWRLPTKIELESILDETRYSPAIDTFYFPATPNHAFWTSTLFTGLPDNAYYVGFATGLSSYGETKFKADVRCVR